MLLMTINSISPFWYGIGGVAIVGVAFIAYHYFRMSSEISVLVEELSPKLKHFSGSMNALVDIINDTDIVFANVTFENISQIIDAHGSDRVKEWFLGFSNDRKEWDKKLYKDKATKMLELLKSCGISRCKEKELQWNEEAAKRYRRLSKIEIGKQCKVVAPYWIYKNDIFEKGLVEPK